MDLFLYMTNYPEVNPEEKYLQEPDTYVSSKDIDTLAGALEQSLAKRKVQTEAEEKLHGKPKYVRKHGSHKLVPVYD